MNSWICDGIAKNGQDYPDKGGEHEPYENFGPDCVICGLPQEAMQAGKVRGKKGETQVSQRRGLPWLPILIVVVILVFFLGGGFFAVKMLIGNNNDENGETTPSPSPSNLKPFVSQGASNPQSISQGEKILLDSTTDKQQAASQLAAQNWEAAISTYQQATNNNPNDPESTIYFHNAQARKKGNPLTIAVAVPLTANSDTAKEVLRGVAQAQTEFNQSAPQPLEVVIFDYGKDTQASSIAQDLTNAGQVLAVLGYGVDPASIQALKVYEDAGMAVLSPLTTSVSQSTLKTIPSDQKTNELAGNYLQAVGKTLSQYASQQNPSPAVAIFFNADSPYSQQLKQELVKALPSVNGKVVKEINTAQSGFNAVSEVANVGSGGANTLILALSQNQVEQGIEIAQANKNAGSPLLLLGGDELYNPDILARGGNAIEGMVLAVPWSFQPGSPFADKALSSWKGRVSWRTATAYDATKALANTVSQTTNRSGVNQSLNQGVFMAGNATNFQIFQEVPLVKAVKGNSGPPGSQYQFNPIP